MSKNKVSFHNQQDLDGMPLLQANYHSQVFSKHTHEGICIGVIQSGAQRFYRSGEIHTAPKNNIIIVNSDEVHTGETATEGGWSYNAIYSELQQIERISNEMLGPNNGASYFPNAVESDRQTSHMLNRMYRVLSKSTNSLERQLWFIAAMSMLLTRCAKSKLEFRPLLNEHKAIATVKDYLQENYAHNVSLEELSQLVDLSPQYLLRQFKKATGLPPHAFQIQHRLRVAKQELALPYANIADIAIDCGFVDQSHFHQHFKRAFGLTPKQYVNSFKSAFSYKN